MNKYRHYIPWFFFLMCSALLGRSQNQIAVTATANRNQILIGEPIQVTLEARFPLGMPMTWFELDSLPHFDYIEKGKLDSTVTQDGRSYRQDILITSFDSGTFKIPSFGVVINNQKYLTDSISVQVSYSKIDPNQDYHDIKDIIDVQNESVKYVIWYVAALTLLSLAGFIYFVRKERVIEMIKEPEVVIPLISPYDEAMQALTALQAQNLDSSGQQKLFYTRLNDIFRMYVFRKLQIASLSKTNDELILQLKNLDMSREHFSKLAETLRMSDFVKFAKYVPGQAENSNSFTVIRSSIDILNEITR
jgi:hypothetical protein